MKTRFTIFLTLLGVVFRQSCGAAWQMKQAPLMTQWAAQVNTNAPFPDYPRPQMARSSWLNLNGIWQFQSGATNDPVPANQTLTGNILVPFPMESAISGVMKYSQFSWYRQLFNVPANWSGKRILLHLDAVNWQSQVYINGQSVGLHKGGYDPITCDITPYLSGSGAQEIIVQVYSPVDNGSEPRGKQTLYPGGIMYTSSSGIWQSVWLEPVDAAGIQNLVLVPDVDNSLLRLTVNSYATNGVTVSASVSSNGVAITNFSGNANTLLSIPVVNSRLWSPNDPFLYDLKITTAIGSVTNDVVTSYFGMRKIATNVVNGVPQMFLNNQPSFQMGPLDQGFWPDGLYTAPTEDALKFDLLQEKALGFNMVRKHIKVEPQRWYYWADKLGLLVWQDMPSCNSYSSSTNLPAVDPAQFITELTRMVTNHWNSPAIIMWDIFNESQGQENTSGGVGQSSTATLVQLVKTLDPSRLVNQASGGSYYGVGDVYDLHSYPSPGNPSSTTKVPVDGEYGGIGYQLAGHLWNPALAAGDYTGASTTGDIAPIYDTFSQNLITYKNSSTGLNAAVYTQITDVENECNGLMTYDRLMKPDPLQILISNQKAITGISSSITLLPTSVGSGATWNYVTNYTTNNIPTNWFATNYNDSAWAAGTAGFGTTSPGSVVRTAWNTADIWLRRKVLLGNFGANDLKNIVLNCYHDEGCEIYLNGAFVSSATGYSTSYVQLPINATGLAALIPNATNYLAVHCHQTTGGQYIDFGISEQFLTANALVLPQDDNGYWKLDETSGTNAADASFGGNVGKVFGASWNASGKINGCLTFNGSNNYVQIARTISNDFSIAFWIKTTQTSASGQWNNGVGLVDADSAGVANDFGTAVCAGKFAFGVGNPDKTIFSATSINDGNWHHCVATRQQTNGAMNLYVDGNLEAAGTGNTNSLTASANVLFGAIASGGGYFAGSLDDIQIFSRAIGNNEIAVLYQTSAFAPAAPTNLSAVAGNLQVTLSWNQSLTATNYVIGRATQSGGPYTFMTNTTAITFQDNVLTNGTTYFYILRAVNASGTGTNSVEVRATPFVLAAWFKADVITGIPNGSAVASWNDVSGLGNHAVQVNSFQQPAYVTGAMNGWPVVRFTASRSNYLAFPRPVQNDFTILCVFQSTQGSGTGTYYYQGVGLVNGEVSGSVSDFGSCLFANGKVSAGTGNPDVSIISAAGFNDSLPHVMTLKRTMSSGAVALYMDGTLAGTTTGSTQSLTAPTQLVLGAQQTLINFLSGDIAEVKIFSSALSATDQATEESALKCKYNIGGGGAPLPPAGLNGNAGNRNVALSWQPSSNATSYSIARSTNNGANYVSIAIGLTATNFLDATAANGATNYYTVSAAGSCGTGSSSSAFAVFLPLPALSISQSANHVLTLRWPTSANDWNLFSATNLNTPINWIPVTNSATTTNNQFSVSLPQTSSAQFFRLSSP